MAQLHFSRAGLASETMKREGQKTVLRISQIHKDENTLKISS